MKRTEHEKPRVSNINLQAMEVFCEVLRLQSFSRGAAAVGISQSAASQLVAHLEEELEFRLIDRQKRPLGPTPAGQIYYLGCQELLHRHRAILDEAHRHQKALAGTVRVVSIYSVGLHTLDRFVKKFMAEHQGSRVALEFLHPNRVYSAVLNDEADIGVVSYPKSNRTLRLIPWLEEEMVLACPRDHPLAKEKSLVLEDLQGVRYVAFDPDLRIRREIDRVLRNRHSTVDVVGEFDNIETIKHALEVSEAVSILPRPSIQREVKRGTLVELFLTGEDLTRPVGIICKRRRKFTPTTEKFVATLLEEQPRVGGGTAVPRKTRTERGTRTR